MLPHPPYSHSLAVSDFSLCRSLPSSLCGINFSSDEAVNQWLDKFFADKDTSFYERGIMKIVEQKDNISLILIFVLYINKRP